MTQSRWHLHVSDDGEAVLVDVGSGGRWRFASVEEAVALADAIRAECLPDTVAAPSPIRIRQAWQVSDDPHVGIVLHVQAPNLTAYELGALRDAVEAVEKLIYRIRIRFGLVEADAS